MAVVSGVWTVDGYRLNDLTAPPATIDTYAYDNVGRVTGETPRGGSRIYTYGATTGQLTGFTQTLTGANRPTTLTHDTTGRIATETTGSAVTIPSVTQVALVENGWVLIA
jgi:hypothetical protein